MRVIVEIVHPANVLFFLRPIRVLLTRGDEVLILSRHKDVAPALLDSFGLPHRPVSSAGRGLAGLAYELVKRDLRILREARRFRPHVMIGYGGVAISHVGRILRIPAISFYDTEQAVLQTRLTWPFITHLYVPEAYHGKGPHKRMTRVPGCKDLSYFNPAAFRPDKAAAIRSGYSPDQDNFLIRVVSWRANHDIGKAGWSQMALAGLVRYLAARGKVHISTERSIPPELAPFQYSGRPTDIHHLLAHCRLYVGESPTMACEAAVLGTPSVYASDDVLGYVGELSAAGLITKLPAVDLQPMLDVVGELLAEPAQRFREAREAWLSNKPDWAEVVVKAIDRHALPVFPADRRDPGRG